MARLPSRTVRVTNRETHLRPEVVPDSSTQRDKDRLRLNIIFKDKGAKSHLELSVAFVKFR
jgi:hypothetical protein